MDAQLCVHRVALHTFSTPQFIVGNTCLVLLTISIIFGNLLVIAAVVHSRRLRNVNSFLITSLAFADLSVGIFVLPFSTPNETLQLWIFGETWCKIWLSIDIWMCTASIFNLVAISVDRYLAITRPLSYPTMVTHKKARVAIILVWLLSFLVCLPSMVNWHSNDGDDDRHRIRLINISISNGSQLISLESVEWSSGGGSSNESRCQCTPMNNNPAYIVFSASCSFFVPMLIIVVLYARIYSTVRQVSKNWFGGVLVVEKASSKRTASNKRATAERAQSTSNVLETELGASNTAAAVNTFADGREGLRLHRGNNSVKSNKSTSFSRQKSLLSITSNSLIQRKKDNHSSKPRCQYNTIALPAQPPRKNSKLHALQCQYQRYKADLLANREHSPIVNHSEQRELVHNSPFLNKNYQHLKNRHRKSIVLSSNQPQPPSSAANNVAHLLRSPFLQRASYSLRQISTRYIMSPDTGKKYNGYQNRILWEIYALKSVAVVTGCFICCWLGFAICYLLRAFPFCSGDNDCVPSTVFSIVFWLGYINSALNPVIYAVFNREFRNTFRKLILALSCLKYAHISSTHSAGK